MSLSSLSCVSFMYLCQVEHSCGTVASIWCKFLRISPQFSSSSARLEKKTMRQELHITNPKVNVLPMLLQPCAEHPHNSCQLMLHFTNLHLVWLRSKTIVWSFWRSRLRNVVRGAADNLNLLPIILKVAFLLSWRHRYSHFWHIHKPHAHPQTHGPWETSLILSSSRGGSECWGWGGGR